MMTTRRWMAAASLAAVGTLGCPASEGETDTESTTATTATTTGTGTSTGSTGEATGTSSTSGATSTSGESTTGESTTTGEATTTGDMTTTGESTTTGDPGVPAIHYVGRHDASDPDVVRMGWSGVGAVFRFDGTAASVSLDDAAGYFTVVVDGEVQAPLVTTPGLQSYSLAAGLPAGEHTVELYRRTEGSFGATAVHGVELTGELLPPPPVDRRIEVIGDSISCGYGNEGVDPCNFSAETENHYRTYGAFAARALGAELSTVAWSGKGVIYNYGDDKNDPLPAIYDRTIATEAAPWSFTWQPDAVVINLGTNDFSTDDDPPQEVFVPAYVDFLVHLREVYPEAFILIVAPSLWGQEATMVAGYLTEVVAQRQADGDSDVAFADINVDWIGAGCNGHPSVATHEAMGAKLAAELGAALGW